MKGKWHTQSDYASNHARDAVSNIIFIQNSANHPNAWIAVPICGSAVHIFIVAEIGSAWKCEKRTRQSNNKIIVLFNKSVIISQTVLLFDIIS